MSQSHWSLKGAKAIASALVMLSASVWAQQPSVALLADVNPGQTNFTDLSINGDMIALNGKLYMAATRDLFRGMELYEYDPATQALRLVKDISPGGGSSFPSEFTEYQGKLYFRAQAGFSGNELFVYDPADDSVEIVVDLRTGLYQGSSPFQLTVFDNKLYFAATGQDNVARIYQYDGSSGALTPIDPPNVPWSYLVSTANGLFLVLYQETTDTVTFNRYNFYRLGAGETAFSRYEVPTPDCDVWCSDSERSRCGWPRRRDCPQLGRYHQRHSVIRYQSSNADLLSAQW